MERSLSILLPTHNAQATLRPAVFKVLELAAELTARFEILIIDEASSDHTPEIAYELSRYYPQIGVARLARRGGLADAVRLGLERTSGEIICIHEGGGRIDVADLRRLWQMRDDAGLVLARHSSNNSLAADGWLERLVGADAPAAKASGSGFHLLRRDAIEALQAGHALTASQHEIRIRPDQPAALAPKQPRRPNFLEKFKSLALGE